MKSINLNCYAFLNKFKQHGSIKNKLLKLINKTIVDKECDPRDKIDALDWDNSVNIEREWVKFILPDLKKHFIDCIKHIHLKNVCIRNIWFQKYSKEGVHNWHVHSNNYTGVYYLKFPKGSSKTELIDREKIIPIDAKEGDIIIFPSFIIHRSSKMKENVKKMIVSFNLDFDAIDEDYTDSL